MFNRAVSVQLVKTPKPGKDGTAEPTETEIDWEKIGKITQETAKEVSKVVVVAYAAKKLIDTASHIAIIAARSKI